MWMGCSCKLYWARGAHRTNFLLNNFFLLIRLRFCQGVGALPSSSQARFLAPTKAHQRELGIKVKFNIISIRITCNERMKGSQRGGRQCRKSPGGKRKERRPALGRTHRKARHERLPIQGVKRISKTLVYLSTQRQTSFRIR